MSQNDDDSSNHLEADPFADDDAFLAMMKARMPQRGQRIVERLERVKSVYVTCGRDKALADSFDGFMRNFFARRGSGRDEAEVFFVTGESGAGKSAAIERLLSREPLLKPIEGPFGTTSPYVSIKLRGFTHPRIAGRNIISAAGYPIRQDTQRAEIWDVMAARLKARRVFLVHIDETQHLIKQSASQKEREELANAIKGVSIDRDWPVAFLLSGLPGVAQLPLNDEQFERRGGAFIAFTDVKLPEERKLVTKILVKMCEAAGLGVSRLLETDLPERLAHAARYRYARICQITLEAIHAALAADDDPHELTLTDFARAYATRSHALGRDDMNPFLVDRWTALKPGSFLIDDTDEN
ncbi:ATP-binding protein [Bosea sp. ASV33]|uniref:ATP-binding protein n=1 Tax=Bosea sp. ASV33 TaxID=2795106 RepID=UPI0018ED28A8|nr:ATP-binding protein [Bosea sp. ASV33]